MNNLFIMNLNTLGNEPATNVNSFEEKIIWIMTNEQFEERILDTKNYRTDAVRGVILNNDGKVAIIHSRAEQYYKLPGWWVETGENTYVAMIREWKEETGADIVVWTYIWTIIEQSKTGKIIQHNRWFVAKVIWDIWTAELTDEEVERKFEVLRLTINEAIELMKNHSPISYRWEFMQTRDLKFLEEATMLISL